MRRLLLHDNVWPNTSLRISEANAKMGRTVLPHPAQSPNLAPTDCHLFGPVKYALRGRHFADDNELKQYFRDVACSEVEAGNFTTLVCSVLLNVRKSVSKMQRLSKNGLVIAKEASYRPSYKVQ
jgi:hypothetical protein